MNLKTGLPNRSKMNIIRDARKKGGQRRVLQAFDNTENSVKCSVVLSQVTVIDGEKNTIKGLMKAFNTGNKENVGS